ncbi:UNVERIFIED_CONTAM: hypothetical protein Scaly_2247700 [Sesamum calycinum]|uniref:Uncharacterized protein n=1 Tax=Sesamum calycinum TaxID=2727403 RepID=A0AAW2MDC6_9LAMI
MGRSTGVSVSASAPRVAPPAVSGVDREDHWGSFDNSVNAVSFGFVATAILISMFLVMAIFERFLRPRSPDAAGGGGRTPAGGDENMRKLDDPSPKDENGSAIIGSMSGKEYKSTLRLLSSIPLSPPKKKKKKGFLVFQVRAVREKLTVFLVVN